MRRDGTAPLSTRRLAPPAFVGYAGVARNFPASPAIYPHNHVLNRPPSLRLGGALLSWLLTAVAPAAGQNNDAAGNDTGPDDKPPVAVWRFEGPAELGVTAAVRAALEPGPRPPAYPGFAAENHAYRSGGPGLRVREADLPPGTLRFDGDDAITIEAWVKVRELKNGSYAYIVGKGRQRKPGFPEKNQNYSLRLKGEQGEARVCFLFSSAADAKGTPSDWHRWTSSSGFPVDAGWHHVALTYTFGKPDSVRGVVDGRVAAGTWDMGGATDRAPVADADDLMIGTGNGGGAGNTFQGWIDDLTIWRAALPEATLTQRYQFVPPPSVAKPDTFKPADLPAGSVLVQLCEGALPILKGNAWPAAAPVVTESYREDVFGFFEVPQKYVETGVRGDRGHPYLFRAAARVPLPAGEHRLLLRSRGASRLTIDGKVVLTTPFPDGDSGGHDHVRKPESYLNLGPDFRFAPPGTAEATTKFTARGGEVTVVLESIVGGYLGKARRRPELGETVVAVSPKESESWFLLSPGRRVVPYTDTGWEAYEAERRARLEEVNAKARAAARELHRAYWDRRRDAAKKWLASTPEVPVPAPTPAAPAHNAIDHFLNARMSQVAAQLRKADGGSVDYFKQVLPLLEARCYDCHAGGKVKGGLRLDDRAAALKGGDSGAGIVPGKPAEGELLARVRSTEEGMMPPRGERLTKEQIGVLEAWVREGAAWPDARPERTTPTPLTDDLAFLRRVTLDTVGVTPSPEEIRAFVADKSPDKRAKAIDRLLADPRWADLWMGYWQDVLAENPNILNPTLNNTGPFRWWLYESLVDNKPFDLFVTELLRMKGSERFGGPAGFAVASQNDVPMAAKGTIVATAFLGVEMKCARCHDAPSHRSTQEQLFQLAALLGGKTLTVPKTSSVPADKLHQGGRTPLIKVTLKPGASVKPQWPFAEFADESLAKQLAENADDSRDRLAALVTAPQNERFARVLANRVWKRFMGRGLVEPVDDWERGKPTHPELLRWLGRELVRGGYDVKHLSRLILNSHAYQRATDPTLHEQGVLYAAPAPRRLTAEQIVDALFAATGKPMRLEEVSLDIDGRRSLDSSISLGQPRRAWMLTSTSNERDRPSLALPRIQAVTDVLAAFGWRAARQEPTSVRDQAPNVLQPAILSNGTMGVWLTRLSDDHGVTAIALRDQSLDEMLDALFLRMLTRRPTDEERATCTAVLKPGYESRIRPAPGGAVKRERKPEPYVSWSNHLDPEATIVRQKQEIAARRGDLPTERLDSNWRGRLEDVVWALVNSSEFLFVP
jgi:hypothetical protein